MKQGEGRLTGRRRSPDRMARASRPKGSSRWPDFKGNTSRRLLTSYIPRRGKNHVGSLLKTNAIRKRFASRRRPARSPWSTVKFRDNAQRRRVTQLYATRSTSRGSHGTTEETLPASRR